MKKILILIGCVIILNGCWQQAVIETTEIKSNTNTNTTKIKPEGVYIETKEECDELNGYYMPLDVLDTAEYKYKCQLPTNDAGKSCTDSSECETYCLAPKGSKAGDKITGTCMEYTDEICKQLVENGVADGMICY